MLMTNIIDINDVSTYPKELLYGFDNNTDINYDLVFANYDFKCVHVTCTSDIENYNLLGIMRPFRVFSNNHFEINTTLKDIMLKPISNREDYSYYADKYDSLLLKVYEANKDIVKDWYGKYSCVCYTMDPIGKINTDNPGYEPMIDCYGGEIFRDLGFSDKEAEEIAKDCKAYAIFFKLSYDEIKNSPTIIFSNLINHMKKMYMFGNSDYGFESCINKDIPPTDFIEIKEIDKL